ncbi:MAG TPA: PAS domain S-box protein [Alphaproteobacteria bacterium]|jgi:PAS domain S-box-containing protein
MTVPPAEFKRAERDREFDAIAAGISDGFVSFDNEWRFTHVNQAAERLWRRKASELLGRKSFDVLKIDPDNIFNAQYIESKRTGEPTAFSALSENFGGWLEVRGYPHAAGYSIFVRDVSEERRAHLALRESERKLEAARRTNQRIFETTLDLILVVDRQGNIIQVSPSAWAILGYRPEELIARNAGDFLYPGDLDRTRNEMRMARRGRVMRNFETRYMHKDGRVVPLTWTGIWAEAEQQHFFIGRDMTERNAAEERLRRAQRLEAVGQLTGGIAHDFNNLLTVIIGNLDLLQDRLQADPRGADYGSRALKAAMRGAALTRQLLAFARRQALDAKVIDINERVAATMDLLHRTIGEDIEITTALAPDLWPAFADPGQLESAIVNLAINARDAMPQGGRLIIETANKRIDENYVAKNFDAVPGDYVMLAVSDTGSGMPPEVLARVFEPFFTTKPVGKGTGLGLSMVYGFVRQSQGHVQIYSEAGHGTSVRLYLPRARSATEPAAEAPAEAVSRARTGERILAVEDNPDVRRVVTAQLSELGYEVLEAANGEAAIRILERGDAIDLLFSDVVMPGGMSGYDLARATRRLRPSLKVLLTSGFPKTAMEDQRPPSEAGHLLSKPYRKAELAAKIRSVLDG